MEDEDGEGNKGSGAANSAAGTPSGANSGKKAPKRGFMAKAAKLLPASKLSFEPVPNEDEADSKEDKEENKEQQQEENKETEEVKEEAKVINSYAVFI